MRLQFTIYGAPRTKKNRPRVVYVGKRCHACNRGQFPKLLPTEVHQEWFARALLQARMVRARVMPRALTERVNVAAVFWRDALRGDALGYFEALADLLQAAGIVINDEQCVTWNGSRLEKDARRPRIDVVITNAVAASGSA